MSATREHPTKPWIYGQFVHWGTISLLGVVVSSALVLNVAVLDAGPKPAASAVESQAVAPVVDALDVAGAVPGFEVLPAESVPSTGPVGSTVDGSVAAPTASGQAASQPGSRSAAASAFVPAPAPTPTPVDPDAPATTSAAQPADATASQPTAPAATNAPVTTSAPTTTKAPATTSAPTTTKAPATTSAPAPTQAPTTTVAPQTQYLTYTVAGGVGQVILARTGNSISLYGFYPNSGWVYEVERNGPTTVKLGFFNSGTDAEREWTAALESGQIKIEN